MFYVFNEPVSFFTVAQPPAWVIISSSFASSATEDKASFLPDFLLFSAPRQNHLSIVISILAHFTLFVKSF